MKESNLTFSIIIIGDAGVGKTSIYRRYVYETFDQNTLSTIGLQFSFKDVELNNKKIIKLKLIDTAGEEKYRSLSKSYFRNADAAIFVFAFDNLSSFQNITNWIEIFKNNHDRVDKIPKYLVGNKNDLEKKVEKNLIDDLQKKIGYKYFSTSALNNDNIEELFKDLAEKVFKSYNPNAKQKNIQVAKQETFKKSKCNLCNEH